MKPESQKSDSGGVVRDGEKSKIENSKSKKRVRFRQGGARRREIENRKLEIEKESQIPAGWCACERADTWAAPTSRSAAARFGRVEREQIAGGSGTRPYVALGGGTIRSG
ncbi:hypothetical protein IT157_04230 [bacterium]|nr:hypothetical protein [bacterium]